MLSYVYVLYLTNMSCILGKNLIHDGHIYIFIMCTVDLNYSPRLVATACVSRLLRGCDLPMIEKTTCWQHGVSSWAAPCCQPEKQITLLSPAATNVLLVSIELLQKHAPLVQDSHREHFLFLSFVSLCRALFNISYVSNLGKEIVESVFGIIAFYDV